jgi:hypothetical protein
MSLHPQGVGEHGRTSSSQHPQQPSFKSIDFRNLEYHRIVGTGEVYALKVGADAFHGAITDL